MRYARLLQSKPEKPNPGVRFGLRFPLAQRSRNWLLGVVENPALTSADDVPYTRHRTRGTPRRLKGSSHVTTSWISASWWRLGCWKNRAWIGTSPETWYARVSGCAGAEVTLRPCSIWMPHQVSARLRDA